jgi:ribosomal protein S18 acetylase RimI-like enzyme
VTDSEVIVRDARPGELAEVGELRVRAYQAGGFLAAKSDYEPVLRALGTAGDGTVLVAVSPDDDSRILGTVMLQPAPHAGEIAADRDEAEIRALAVVPGGQGRGTGTALLRAVIELARQQGVRHLVLLTQAGMRTAQHLYELAGFRRLPERDWSPAPGISLLAYGLLLAEAAALRPPGRPPGQQTAG